jgi:hypothetical protein
VAVKVTFGAVGPTVSVNVSDANGVVIATALLDSGCDMTGISQRVVNALSLKRTGSVSLAGTTGNMTVDAFAVDLDFAPAGLTTTGRLTTLQVFEIQGNLGVDVLIGRDIICHGSSVSQLTLGPGGSGSFDV